MYRWEEWDAATSRAMQQRALQGQARYGSPEAGYSSDLEEKDRSDPHLVSSPAACISCDANGPQAGWCCLLKHNVSTYVFQNREDSRKSCSLNAEQVVLILQS